MAPTSANDNGKTRKSLPVWAQRPPNWFAPDILFCFIAIVPIAVYQLPVQGTRAWQLYGDVPGLVPGWLFGRKRDASDAQWNEWRKVFPILLVVLVAWALLSRYARRWLAARFPGSRLRPTTKIAGYSADQFDGSGGGAATAGASATAAMSAATSTTATTSATAAAAATTGAASSESMSVWAETASPGVVAYYAAWSLAFIVAAHGSDAAFVLGILGVNYALAKLTLGTRAFAYVTFVFNVGVLFYAGELGIDWRNVLFFVDRRAPLFDWLAATRGPINYRVYFKITTLRIISFNMDWHWARLRRTYRRRPAANRDAVNERGHTLRDLTEMHHPESDYNFWTMLTHALYLPLYIAGPIEPFNVFLAQLKHPQRLFSLPHIALRLLRVCFYVLLVEAMLHYYGGFFAISEYRLYRPGYFNPPMPSWEVLWVGFVTLWFMWFKFLVIWDFFWSIALIDGHFTQRNLLRCVVNNSTFSGFWRTWHASFNRWTVRYVYVPLGGNKSVLWSVWLIFAFIGLWHDFKWRWLAWALMNAVGMASEVLLMLGVAKARVTERLRDTLPFYRWWAAQALTLLVIPLVLANLAILYGFDFTPVYLRECFARLEWWRLAFTFCFFVPAAVRLQYEIRVQEAWDGKESATRS